MRIAALCAVLACASPRGGWQAPLQRDHPLVGRIWDGAKFVDQQALFDAVRPAHFVLLGETHDNPDHHALQARLVRAVSGKPAVVFEMLEASKQPALDAAPRTPDGIAQAVEWAQSGWPGFAMYRPIFEAALALDLPLVAGNLTKAQMTAIVLQGQLPPPIAALLARETAPSEAELRAVREEMKAQHCGQLPDSMLEPMAQAQRARDAQLALTMARPEGSILIAGSGHARSDRGVPLHLALLAPGQRAVSVAFVEVAEGKLAPDAYAGEYAVARLPFDFVWFTPAAAREDPCKALERRMKRTQPPPGPTRPTSSDTQKI